MISHFRNVCLWGSAILLVLIPVLLAADFGGVYHWSQYVGAVGIVVASVLALAGLGDSTASSGLRQHAILLPLGGLVAWAWLQGLSLPAGVVSWLSPGSYAAYTEWLDGLEPGSAASRRFSLSVSPTDTAHVAALLTVLLPLCWAASIVFHARSRLTLLLSGLAISGASVAILGFYRKLDPSADLWMFDGSARGFGGFVNRNNAALMLNLGLAASLGLLSWRMMALHSVELDDPDFEFNDLVALISDRESFVGLCSGTACIAGLLVNGSRGGLVAAMFGLMLAFGYVRPQRGLLSIPVLAVVLAISVVVLITPMNLNLDSLTRWEFVSNDAKTLQSDGRLLHWQDGWRAAAAYLPGGAGLSSYAYAYLPYQKISPGGWFEHADNLWLEMLLETGIVGVLVAASFLAILLISLKRLSYSADPIDQGIRVAGWYAIAAVLVSQLFDFGLAMPANLIAALLLATAVVSRDIANGGAIAQPTYYSDQHYDYSDQHDEQYVDDENEEPEEDLAPANAPAELAGQAAGPKIRLQSEVNAAGWRRLIPTGRPATAALALGAILLGGMALPALRQDAVSDAMLTRLNDEYHQWRLNPESLAKMEQALQQRVDARPSPLVLARLSLVQRDRGRLAETVEWQPRTQEELQEIYRLTALQDRQLPYPPQPKTPHRGKSESRQHYQDAWQTSLATLAICPLAQEPRGSLVRLQSVVAEPPTPPGRPESKPAKVASVAAKHLLVFYASDASRLFALGKESLSRDDAEVAQQAFHAALSRNPSLTTQVMKLLHEHRNIEIAAVIPQEPEAMRLAVAEYIHWENPDRAYLEKSTRLIPEAGGKTMAQRAQAQALVGQVHFFLADPEKGQDYYQRAIRLAPDRAGLRVELIEHLLQHGLNSEALSQARLGRQSIADDPRFQELIDRIADSDRAQLTEPAAAPQIDRKKLDAVLKTTPD